jgi:hypothetical protein
MSKRRPARIVVITLWRENATGEFRARILDDAASPEHRHRSIVVATAQAVLYEVKTILNEFADNSSCKDLG